MSRARLVGRAAIPDTGRGQKPYAYHLARGARVLAPEVADIPRSNSVFHGLGKNPWHGYIKVREELKWLEKYGGK